LAAESATALNAKDYAKAQTAAAEATRLDPQFEEAWVGYGMASARLGQADRARDAYEHALALHQARMLLASPDAGQVFQQIFLLSLLGRAGEAETLLSRARLVFPADPQISMLASNFSQFQKLWAGWAVKPK
jgi:Flp pilus assembly protein TadD